MTGRTNTLPFAQMQTVYSLKDIYLYLMPSPPPACKHKQTTLVCGGEHWPCQSRAQQSWSCRRCEATASLHTCCFFFFFFSNASGDEAFRSFNMTLFFIYIFKIAASGAYTKGDHTFFRSLTNLCWDIVIQTETNVEVSVPLTP